MVRKKIYHGRRTLRQNENPEVKTHCLQEFLKMKILRESNSIYFLLCTIIDVRKDNTAKILFFIDILIIFAYIWNKGLWHKNLYEFILQGSKVILRKDRLAIQKNINLSLVG